MTAAAWLIERAFGYTNPIGSLVDRAPNYAIPIAIPLAASALWSTASERERRAATST